MLVRFILNGEKTEKHVSADTSLLEMLRQCACHSVRGGCDSTNCGICTVWVDGTPVLSCSYPAARAEGHQITTLEGVGEEKARLLDIMAEEAADQCGYCSPGFIMTAIAMRRELKNPTDKEIDKYMAGNLCRCTGYTSQSRALRRWLKEGM